MRISNAHGVSHLRVLWRVPIHLLDDAIGGVRHAFGYATPEPHLHLPQLHRLELVDFCLRSHVPLISNEPLNLPYREIDLSHSKCIFKRSYCRAARSDYLGIAGLFVAEGFFAWR